MRQLGLTMTVLLVLLLEVCWTKSINDASKEAFNLNEESAKKIVDTLGWSDKKEITKEEFKDFFLKILYRNDENKINNLSLGIIERYIADFPDTIEVKDFPKWVSYERFMEAMKAAVRDMFGEEYVQEVVKAFEEKEYEEEMEKDKEENIEDL